MAGGAPSVVVSDLVETASGRIDTALRVAQDAGVRRTAEELSDFLMTVAKRLERFYTEDQRPAEEVADASAW